MTAYQTVVAKIRDQQASTTPAEVAKRIIRGVLEREISDDKTSTLNNAMHVAYGTSWGAVYGLTQSTVHASPVRHGAAFGTGVWAAASFVELPAMQLAPPPWEYPPLELALDISYHLVYGVGVAAAYALLDR